MTGTERPAGEKEIRDDTGRQTGPMGLQQQKKVAVVGRGWCWWWWWEGRGGDSTQDRRIAQVN